MQSPFKGDELMLSPFKGDELMLIPFKGGEINYSRTTEESCILYSSYIESVCKNILWVGPESGGRGPDGLFGV